MATAIAIQQTPSAKVFSRSSITCAIAEPLLRTKVIAASHPHNTL